MAQNKKGKMRARLDNIQEDTDHELQENTPSSQRLLLTSPISSPLASVTPTRSLINNGLGYVLARIGRNFNRRKGRANVELSPTQNGTSQEMSVQAQGQSTQQGSTGPLIEVQHPSNLPRNPTPGSFFEHSQNVKFKEGTINQTRDQTNMTFHFHPEHHGEKVDTSQQHPALPPRVVEALSQLLTTEPRTSQRNSFPPLVSSPSQIPYHTTTPPPSPLTQDINHGQLPPISMYAQGPSTSTSIYSPDNSNTIYGRHLEQKKKGFPLWIPEPNRSLPMAYRREGVNIGDVGIITPSGGFSFLFNICLPHDNPINPRTLPDGFVPIHPPIEPMDIREYSEFKPESYLASTAIERTDNDPPFRGLSFSTSAAEGAILTLPDGAISRDLVNIRRFRAYAAANIEHWYRYVNGTRGCEAKNGEVRLVTGCVKATSWGMAAVANMTQHKVHHLKYRSVDAEATTAPIPLYKWEHTGFAEARVGPDLSEIEDLKRDDLLNVAVEGKYWNQCLFMHTLNISLSDDGFATISQELDSALIQESHQPQNKGGLGASALLNSSTHTGDSSQQQGMNSTTPTGSTFESLRSASESLTAGNVARERVIISRSQSAPILHPSDILNKMLLQKVPNCRVVITQDEDWCSVIKEEDKIMPGPSQIAERVLATHNIKEENGVVFLEPKERQELDLHRRAVERATILSSDNHSPFYTHTQARGDSSLSSLSQSSFSALYPYSKNTSSLSWARSPKPTRRPLSYPELAWSDSDTSSASSRTSLARSLDPTFLPVRGSRLAWPPPSGNRNTERKKATQAPISGYNRVYLPKLEFDPGRPPTYRKGSDSQSDSNMSSESQGESHYLSDEEEAELQRQAEARAVLLARNQSEDLEFMLARQKLASIDLQPPQNPSQSWNPNATSGAGTGAGGPNNGCITEPTASFAGAATGVLPSGQAATRLIEP